MDSQSYSSKQVDHLFCSEDGLLRVMDIPLSIALSQHVVSTAQPMNKIVSVSAPSQPYTSTEPKSAKAKANLLSRIDADTLGRNERNAAFAHKGLNRVKGLYNGPWLSNRLLDPAIIIPKHLTSSNFKDHIDQPSKTLRNSTAIARAKLQRPLNLSHLGKDTTCTNLDLHYRIIFNPTESVIQVTVVSDEQTCLNIPACSAFYTGKIIPSNVSHFLESTKALYPEPSISVAPGQFDIILMDPPWSNRSVTRGHQYVISDNRHNQDAVSAIGSILPEILGPDGMLAVWITNRAAVRQQVVQMFEDNGIQTIEEWIWLKVTSNGEPVLPINGMYRQPWEICIIGRRNMLDNGMESEIRRKLIVACPELHSRKPWIGSMLIEVYDTPSPNELRKLEIFARCTAASWCAWGEEATKFNDTRWWQQQTS